MMGIANTRVGALEQRLAALEDDGAEAHLGEDQAGEHAAGPQADHHRAMGEPGGRARHLPVGGIGGLDHPLDPALQYGRRIGHVHVDGVDQDDQPITLETHFTHEGIIHAGEHVLTGARPVDKIEKRDAQIKVLRKALAEAALPYEAILMDQPSQKWIAPSVWTAIQEAVSKVRAALAAEPQGETK